MCLIDRTWERVFAIDLPPNWIRSKPLALTPPLIDFLPVGFTQDICVFSE